MPRNALLWLRNDLRVADNPALAAALRCEGAVTALYIEETDPDLRALGGAARWWLHRSLNALGRDLAALGVALAVRRGRAEAVLDAIIAETGAEAVFWSRRYGPTERRLDETIKTGLRRRGMVCESFNAALLVEPWAIATGQGKPYSVFTPFWQALKTRDMNAPQPAPTGRQAIAYARADTGYAEPGWARKLSDHWQIGEAAARQAAADFLDGPLEDYAVGRDFPGKDVTSRLSPHLRFGEISPRQLWRAAQARAQAEPRLQTAVDKFLSELAWREFSYHLLYHRADIATVPMQEKYRDMSWRSDAGSLEAWQRGMTGLPIVDAGMRQLWATGWMHNRVRMLVASLLAKNLLIDWRLGENWFWDTLVDADPANNPASWQWVAGSGADAAPYFRIFNPVTQGERFDAEGAYVRRWVPELAGLPDAWVQKPHEAPETVLRKAGITLGRNYPQPVVDLKTSRQRALAAVQGGRAD